ncbi:hypothetical protein DM01DRAFT_1266273, partial [Hesseltinella vesiculosa]
ISPVILEIQNVVNKGFMASAIQYCLNAYRRFNTYPILVINCIEKIASKALADEFTPTDKPFCLQTPCTHWAKNCFFLSKNNIIPFVQGDDIQPLDPFVALVHFLTSEQQSIISIDHWDDPSIQLLCRMAKDIQDGDNDKKNKKVNALTTICEATGSQFAKIAR